MASLPAPRLTLPSAGTAAGGAACGGDHRWHASAAPASHPPRTLVLRQRCRCRNPSSPEDGSRGRRRWDYLLHEAMQSAVRKCGEYLSSYWDTTSSLGRQSKVEDANTVREKGDKEAEEAGMGSVLNEDWDWDRWKRHFALIKEREQLMDDLKLQLEAAIAGEDYGRAQKLKLLIKASAKDDIVGKGISEMQRAVEEERYSDAAFIRDHIGAGMLGWWSGLSDNASEPFGLLIQISAEHGRYVAKSYNLRQLVTAEPGFPIFEIYFAETNGEYKEQAVYLKPCTDVPSAETKAGEKLGTGSIDLTNSILGRKSKDNDEDINTVDEDDDDDDSDLAANLDDLQNLPRDLMPIFKIKVLKVVAPGKIDNISKIIGQLLEEEDDDTLEMENILSEAEDEQNESDSGDDDNSVDANIDTSNSDEGIPTFISFGPVIDDDIPKSFEHIPARLEKRNRWSFSLHVDQKLKQKERKATKKVSEKQISRTIRRGADLLLPELQKIIGSKKKLSLKILKLHTNRSKNLVHQGLFGVTHFNRIVAPVTTDPLSGLYAAPSGLDSQIIYLDRKFGQWKDDSSAQSSNLEFYEYVEAIKLIGDRLVPAGQVLFRAKVGKQNQLPHKGIIPRELGVVARYKGQGRIADEGFKNPRWIDGELLILDGKFVRDGPVIAFFYWTTTMHLFEFFNRLRLPN